MLKNDIKEIFPKNYIKNDNYFYQIKFLLGSDFKKVPWMVLIFLASGILDLIGLSLIGPYIGIITGNDKGINLFFLNIENIQKEHLLIYLGSVLIFIFLIKAFASIFIHFIILQFAYGREIKIKSHLLTSYINFPLIQIMNRNSSDFIYNINNLVSQFTFFVVYPFLKVTSDLIIAFVIIVFLGFQNIFALGLFCGLLLVTIFLYDKFFRSKLPKYGEVVNKAQSKSVQGIQQAIDGIKEIRVLNVENYFHNHVLTEVKTMAKYNKLHNIITNAPRYLLEFVMILFLFLLVLSMMIIEGQDSNKFIATVTVFGFAGLRLLPSANIVATCIGQIRFARDGVNRLYEDILNIESTNELKSKEIFENKKTKLLTLSVDNISFRYPKAKSNVIHKLSFNVNEGECIGIVGESGSGKSTLLDLILGFLKPDKGKVLLNDRSIKSNLRTWRSCVAFLPQEVFIMDDTLEKNITLGVEYANFKDKVMSALNKAKLSTFAKSLPNGLETFLGERGTRLSGGQRQRVAIARALYHNRDVLILDEATSSVDSKTETMIVNEINNLKGKITMIIIAHRISTLKFCDRIYELNNGTITGSKTYKELANIKF